MASNINEWDNLSALPLNAALVCNRLQQFETAGLFMKKKLMYTKKSLSDLLKKIVVIVLFIVIFKAIHYIFHTPREWQQQFSMFGLEITHHAYRLR